MLETPVQFLGWEDPLAKDRLPTPVFLGFPCGSAGKKSACNARDLGLIPGLGRSPGEGKGYPLQYSGLENFTDCIVLGVTRSRTRLSDFHFLYLLSEVKVAQSCPTPCDPMNYIVCGILQARMLEWVAPSLLQGIFPTQGLNPGIPHCGWNFHDLSHKGSFLPAINHD